jgi:class 3 adenylate cyclase/tetratricopeptide (TPR) repeat protein
VCGRGLPATGRGDERRLVTVLFADLVGYTALAETRDPEQVKNLVDACFERLIADIVTHGGRVDKIVGDAIMALFGAPLAHEDDAERAVRAGLAMQESLAAWSTELGGESIQMRVGINSGEVLVGALRAGGDYTAMGDVVNTANRLQTIAEPGQVLVGNVTHAATRDVLRYRSLGLVRAKGREEAVPAWVAVEAVAPPGHRPRRVRTPLVGREPELGLLRHALAIATERRRAQLVVLSGDAGTGKTRLAEELASLARNERHAFVLEGRCVPYGESNVWWPLAEALRRSCGIEPCDSPAVAEGKGRTLVETMVGAAPGYDVDRIMQGISYLMDHGKLADVEPARARDEALRSVHLCLDLITAERPLVFVISELHWADDLLLEFLDRLLDRVQHLPILLVATARPELAERWQPPVGRHNQIVLHLDPLDAASTGDLLAELLSEVPSPELRDALVERSGGNPLYLEELVALLDDDRPLDELPVTLRGLVAARLDGLGPAERATLEDAAVIGRTGSLEALVALASADRAGGETGVSAALDSLVAADVLMAVDTGWGFRSELVREVGYTILTKAARARRHAAMAEWLAARVGDRPGGEDFDALAHHYGTAAELVVELDGVTGVPSDLGVKALGWLERAAIRAESEELWPAAVGLLDQALRLAVFGDAAARDRLVLARARARVGLRDAVGAAEDVAESLVSAEARGDESLEAKAMVLRGEVERLEGRMERSSATLSQAVDRARQLGDDQVIADGLRALGQTRLFMGDEEGADEVSVQALAAYRNLGDRRGEAWALQSLAWTAFLRSDFGPAEDRLRASADAFSEIGDWGGHSWAIGLLGWVRYGQGRLEEAEDIGRRILVDAESGGDRWALGMMTVLLVNITLWTGRTREASVLAAKATALFEGIEDHWARLQAVIPQARTLLALGEIAEGRALLAQLEAGLGSVSDRRMRRLGQGAVVIASTQQLGEGPAVLGLASDLIEGESGEIMAEQLSALGLALLQCGRLDEGVARLEEALSRCEGGAPPNVGAMVALGLVAGGQIDAAVAVLDGYTGPERGTYIDRAWAQVGRGFVALARGDGPGVQVAFECARQLVDGTEDRLSQAVVRLAHHVAVSATAAGLAAEVEWLAVEAYDRMNRLGVTFPGWERVFRLMSGAAPAHDAVVLAT